MRTLKELESPKSSKRRPPLESTLYQVMLKCKSQKARRIQWQQRLGPNVYFIDTQMSVHRPESEASLKRQGISKKYTSNSGPAATHETREVSG